MDWLQFFSSVIESLAWPASMIILVALLREPLGKLVPLIRTFKYKDLQIDVGQELEAVKEKVDESGDQPADSQDEPTPAFRQLALIDPRAAVLSAWVPVELALKDLGLKTGAYKVTMPIFILLQKLNELGTVDDRTCDVLGHLKRIRNQAVHLAPISFDEAISMGEMCEWALQKLKTAGAEI
jgi:hypothetical protein